MKKEFKCCAFDSDGVLTNTARCHFNAWHRLASGLGIDLPSEMEPELGGISRLNALKMILSYGHKDGLYTNDELKNLTDLKNFYYQEEIKSVTPDDILPNIKALIDELKENGIKIIVASGSANTPKVLQNVGLLDLFDDIVDPTQFEGKPAPDIFLNAAQLAGVDPSECIGIEDSLAGTKAIKRAGMIAVSIGSISKFYKESDVIISGTNVLNFNFLKNNFDNIQQLRYTEKIYN